MMQYNVEYEIVKGYYDSPSKGIATIGIFVKSKSIRMLSSTELKEDFIVENSITLKSNLGGGAGFPGLKGVISTFIQDYSKDIENFILSIKEEQILLFNLPERYSYALVGLICEKLKQHNKYITCIIDQMPRFMESRKVFETSLKKIEEYSDELILLNIAEEITNKNKSITLPEYYTLRNMIHKERVKFVIWNSFPSNRYNSAHENKINKSRYDKRK